MGETAATSFLDALQERVRDSLDACTGCGKCVEACPMAGPAGVDRSDPPAVVAGLLDLLAGGAGTADARRWAEVCTNSGRCIEACDYGVNPRFLVNMARLAARAQRGEAEVRRAGAAAFNAMSRGVRTLSRLQLPPELLARVNPPRGPESEKGGGKGGEDGDAPPEILFYTGCNVLKTPHIALLCLELLDRLGVRYAVAGGPSHCCGILQFKAGDGKTAGRLGYGTIDKLARAGTTRVLSWCPSCQIQIGEVALPAYARSFGARPFDLDPFFVYVAERLDALRPHLVHRVEKRVALKERPAVPQTMVAVKAILAAIPGLELVDLGLPQVSTQEHHLAVLPDFQRALREQQFAAAAAAGVTTLATVYHACHRELCHYEKDVTFEIVNVMELIGEAMGIAVPDLFKRLKMMGEIDAVLADTADLIARHGLDLDAVRDVLAADMFAGRPAGSARPKA